MTRYEIIAVEIGEAGWSVTPDLLPRVSVIELSVECRQLWQAGELRRAAIGAGGERQVRPDLRGDSLHWLDAGAATPAVSTALGALEEVRLAVNRRLALGLFELEAHLTVYPPGASYGRHLDRHRGSSRRALSLILYLNEDWLPEHGGELRLYSGGDESASHWDVLPHGGTLVCFLSERFPHEVLPATRERMSLTAWFRTRE